MVTNKTIVIGISLSNRSCSYEFNVSIDFWLKTTSQVDVIMLSIILTTQNVKLLPRPNLCHYLMLCHVSGLGEWGRHLPNHFIHKSLTINHSGNKHPQAVLHIQCILCAATGISGLLLSCYWLTPLVSRFMGPTWGPSRADRTQVGPMLAPWTLPSGSDCGIVIGDNLTMHI